MPRHAKLSEIRHRGKGLFKGLPDTLSATRYHSLVVEVVLYLLLVLVQESQEVQVVVLLMMADQLQGHQETCHQLVHLKEILEGDFFKELANGIKGIAGAHRLQTCYHTCGVVNA